MVTILNKKEQDLMRESGKFIAKILKESKKYVQDSFDNNRSVNLLEIDDFVKDIIENQKGAESCYVNYDPDFGDGPFAHYICTSVNDAVLHGKPYDYQLQPDDLLSLDFACSLNGLVTDSAISFICADTDLSRHKLTETEYEPITGVLLETDTQLRKNKLPSINSQLEADLFLIDLTERALAAGIKEAKPGNHIGDISAAIGDVIKDSGIPINLDFGGHGVGHTMHEDPHIPNDGERGTGVKLEPGMAIAIEPWLLMTTDEIAWDEDGWTIVSEDYSRGAHSEHSVLITDGDPEILTLW
ncbi:MAG: M24 family metallopeptidase [Bifidobacteriaceae bacterium]|jgi:methionyl aminopeptidase|nr:M24 family metallopeptidase [Bifidobacteriaceae bacterium]